MLLVVISSGFFYVNARYTTINNEHAPGGKYTIYSGPKEEHVENGGRTHRKLAGYDRRRDIEERIEYYPPEREAKPFSETGHNKVLGLVLAYGFDHMDPFMLLLLPEYVSMCEAGWDPTMVILTAAHWSPLLRRMFTERAYCTRLEKSVKIEWAVYNKNISTWLAAEHRRYIGDRLDKYDVFLYHEDDIPFRAAHLNAYVKATHDLKHRLPWTGLYDYIIGFQRFRHIHRTNLHDDWGEQDIVEQDLLEETPSFETVCVPGEDLQVNPWQTKSGEVAAEKSLGPGKKVVAAAAGTEGDIETETSKKTGRERRSLRSEGKRGRRLSMRQEHRGLAVGDWEKKAVYPYIQAIGNTHQGAFMLTQEQVKILHIKCHFLNHSSPSREYMSSFSLFDTKHYHCGLLKLLPAERMNSFFIHHFYHTKWVSWYTNSMVNDKTRAGEHYIYVGNLSNPVCWKDITSKMKSTLVEQRTLAVAKQNWYGADPIPPGVLGYMPKDKEHGFW